MVLDSEPVRIVKTHDAIGSVAVDLVSKINWKIALFLIFVFVIISTDVFVNRILTNFTNAVDGKIPTNYGTCLQALFLAVAYIFMDIFVRNELV